MNKKNNIIYSKVFESLYDIITENNNLVINVKYIITDSEYALVNNIKKYFPNTIHISCYYHYKKDIISNIKKYGLYKKNDKFTSDLIIKELGKIPLIYKGNIETFNNIIENIIFKFPKYNNFIRNYFVKNKKELFTNGDYNYSKIPQDCKSNSFLENYNKYLKLLLGRKRIINWFNFLNFLKEESDRAYEKLIDIKNYNIEFKLTKTKFYNKYKDYVNENNNIETNLNNINLKLKTSETSDNIVIFNLNNENQNATKFEYKLHLINFLFHLII